MRRSWWAVLAAPVVGALVIAGCGDQGEMSSGTGADTASDLVPVTVRTASGPHRFRVELADNVPEQAAGLMYRTDLKPDGGMLFAPYPAEGGPPREASFWMRNTPSSLDIVFIRADGTIARIAENTVPLSEAPVPSGEPIAAVLEVPGGRMAELGVAEGDRVEWPAPGR
ncbi:DUF192 domain-containing protein [uncultured Sphingomonas sp.]|uniref:DUF192 domain-containing protein n=1 Tax=uncultured Sphingomonas sp. TaxID=158754 RepID=UPI0035CAF5B7